MQNLPENNIKQKISDLAVNGGVPLFRKIRSTSNLFKPEEADFFKYSKVIFESRRLTNNGPLVQLMEERLAKLHEVKHCIAVCNGLWGLIMCLKVLAIKGRTEVIMPSLTYRRMADIAAWVKLTPHFCDVDITTLGMKPEFVEPLINKNTAIILAAHPIVNLTDIDGMVSLANKHNIPIVFDSVEAVYASYKGKMLGSFGEAEVFSMHSSKFLNGFEAGYITTNNNVLAEQLKLMRGFGFEGPDNVRVFGLNAKLNEIHAAMALACLDKVEEQVERNRKRYLVYKKYLKGLKGIELVEYKEDESRSFKTIIVKFNENWKLSRENTIKIMHKENMLVRPYYAPPLHLKKTSYKTIAGNMNNTLKLMDNHMLMPCGEFVDEDDIIRIAGFLKFIEENAEEIKSSL